MLVAPQPFYAERGTPIAVRYVLDALSGLGFEVDVLTLPLGSDVRIPGVRTLRIANPMRVRSVPVGFSLRKLIFDVVMLGAIIRQMRGNHYESVHAVEEGALLALLARAHRKAPLIYDMASSLSEQLAQKPAFRVAPVQALLRRIETFVLRHVDVVVCSAGLAAHVRLIAPDTRVREWRFPSNYRDAGTAAVGQLRAELGIPADAPVILYAGNFSAYQGLGMLYDAVPQVVREVPDAIFVLVGAADQAEIDRALARLVEDFRGNIRCVIRQPRERVDAFLGMATLLISPRTYGGNFPLKVFDYLAAGKPIVATDVPAHRVVLDDSLALLVKPTAAASAEGIIRILKDRDLAAGLAASARRFADEELSMRGFVKLIDELYDQAMQVRASPIGEFHRRGVMPERIEP